MGVWLAEEHLPKFKNATILELGAGPGLCGMIAAHTAKTVVLTDY